MAVGEEVTSFQTGEAGDFKPVIDRVSPLEHIVDAYRYAESGVKTGNVVVGIGDG